MAGGLEPIVEAPCGVRLHLEGSALEERVRDWLRESGSYALAPSLYAPDPAEAAREVCASPWARPGLRNVPLVLLGRNVYAVWTGGSGGPEPPPAAWNGTWGATFSFPGSPDAPPVVALAPGADRYVLYHELGHAVQRKAGVDPDGYLRLREELFRLAGGEGYRLGLGVINPAELFADDFALLFGPYEEVAPRVRAGRPWTTMPFRELGPAWRERLRAHLEDVLASLDRLARSRAW